MRGYLVDQGEVLRIPGSRDYALLKQMLAKEGQGESLAWLDDELADEIEDECPGLSHAQALREIFDGQFTHPDAGFVYGWAFDFICSYLGRWMHDRFHRSSTALLEKLDAEFVQHRVSLRFFGGLIDNCPIALPTDRDGMPGIGFWPPETMRQAAPALHSMLAKETDADMVGVLEEIDGWLAAARDEPQSMVVGVYG